MPTDTAVEFRDVSFAYDRTDALHGITLTLRRGEIVGLLGPNGAGKSTSIKIMAGLLAANAGSVEVLGHAMPQEAVAVKQRIGYVPEGPALFESLTGEEFLELCGRLRGLEEDVLQTRITALLEAFRLGAERIDRIDSYSKGMRQKVLIAAALLHNPELLLLDEPLSGLDVHSALMIKDLLAALAGEGKTVLYSSHVLDVVEKVCDRAIIIHRGRIIAEGSIEGLKAAAGQQSLEDVFRTLTETGSLTADVERIVDVLRG